MKNIFKNAIPKCHYELALDFLNQRLGRFEEFVQSIEETIGVEPGYLQFAEELQNTRLIPLMNMSQEMAILQANVMFHMYNIWQAGRPIYYVTPQLAVELAKTELNVDTEFLLSPHREIYVQIDPGLFSISDPRGEYPVRGFYVFFERHEGGNLEIRVMATSVVSVSDGYLDDANFYFKLHLGPGKLKDVLGVYLGKVLSLDNADELVRFGGAANVNHVDEFTFFVINVLLYLTSKDPDILKQLPVNFTNHLDNIKSPGKRKKFIKQAGKYTECPITIVGPHFEVNQQELNEVRSSGGIGRWKLNHRVRVSAHWKTQWYGSVKEGTRHSKNIRIASYTKGPDAAELLQKKKVVR